MFETLITSVPSMPYLCFYLKDDTVGEQIGPVYINKNNSTLNCFDNTWRHITFVYNNTTSMYYVYFNGVEMISFTGINITSTIPVQILINGSKP